MSGKFFIRKLNYTTLDIHEMSALDAFIEEAVKSKTLNPLNGDVSDSHLNARGGENRHPWKYI